MTQPTFAHGASNLFTREHFITLALARGVLKFGEFTLKSGRISPYFFNAGLLCDGEALALLAAGYAHILKEQSVDVVFGPAYKGIPFASSTATHLWNAYGKSVEWGFNRKEAKNHGEGGMLVGADVQGKCVWIIDDVITAGTAIREVIQLLTQAGATIAGIVVALDRQEVGLSNQSAIEELKAQLNVPVYALLTLNDLISYLETEHASLHLDRLHAYRAQYGLRSLL